MVPPADSPLPATLRRERIVVLLVGAVQFINILDFMMVMPMGPDFSRALSISNASLGVIGGSYTAAAAISGLICSLFLDRFDRRKALACAMFGLVIGTALGGFSTGLYSLIAARVVAGAFGGPATSIAYSIIADCIPTERRGRAMGAVMGAFSIASVVGVPVGLELARRGGFRLPFFAVAGAGLIISLGAIFLLPPMREHLARLNDGPKITASEIFRKPIFVFCYAMTATTMMGTFLVVPSLSPYLQNNLGLPREKLGSYYLIGGLISLVMMRVVGILVDRFGSMRVATFGSCLTAGILYTGFIDYRASYPILGIFIAFMVSNSFRAVSFNTLVTKVPSPRERARFLSIQSAVQHLASATGGFLSAQLLTEVDGKLVGMGRLAWLSMLLVAMLPPLMLLVERRLPVVATGTAAPASASGSA